MTETATGTNPTEPIASSEASAIPPVTAGGETDNPQQTLATQTQTPPATETPATVTTTTEQPAAAAVPETYVFTAPEGKEYDPQVLESFSGAAKAAGLTQDAAQKLIETMAPAIASRQADQVQAINQGWTEASSTDKEFGGEKLKENLGVARRALDTFDPVPMGTDGKPSTTPLRTLLDSTGLGNHPEVIRLLYRAGKAISEDTFVGGVSKPANRNALDVLYPTSKKE